MRDKKQTPGTRRGGVLFWLAGQLPACAGESVDFHQQLDFAGDAAGQGVGADGAARGHALFLAEQRLKEVGSAIDDGGLEGKLIRTVDKAQHLDQAPDTVEVAQLLLQIGQQIEGAQIGGMLPFLEREVDADFADHAFRPHRAGAAGAVEQVAAEFL